MNTAHKKNAGMTLGEAMCHAAPKEWSTYVTLTDTASVAISSAPSIAHEDKIEARARGDFLWLVRKAFLLLRKKLVDGSYVLVGDEFPIGKDSRRVRWPTHLAKYLELVEPNSPRVPWWMDATSVEVGNRGGFDATPASDKKNILLDVRIYPAADVPAELRRTTGAGPAVDGEAEQKPTGEKRGPHPKPYWDDVTSHIMAIANGSDGLPDTQAGIKRLIQKYFSEKNIDEPAESTIRKHIKKVVKFDEDGKPLGLRDPII